MSPLSPPVPLTSAYLLRGEHIVVSRSEVATKSSQEALNAALEANNRLLAELIHVQRFALLGPEKVCQVIFEHEKVDVYVPFGDVDYIQKKLIENRSFYELQNLLQIRDMLAPGAVICDVGANIGNHTLFFAIFCDAAHVHAFEPVMTTFEILARNVELNHLRNVTLYNRPVGVAGEGAAIATYKLRNTGATVIQPASGGAMRYLSLDEIDLPRLDLIKIDVEGQQIAVLKGSRKALKRHRPKIIIEIREKERDETLAVLKELGTRQAAKLSHSDYLFEFS